MVSTRNRQEPEAPVTRASKRRSEVIFEKEVFNDNSSPKPSTCTPIRKRRSDVINKKESTIITTEPSSQKKAVISESNASTTLTPRRSRRLSNSSVETTEIIKPTRSYKRRLSASLDDVTENITKPSDLNDKPVGNTRSKRSRMSIQVPSCISEEDGKVESVSSTKESKKKHTSLTDEAKETTALTDGAKETTSLTDEAKETTSLTDKTEEITSSTDETTVESNTDSKTTGSSSDDELEVVLDDDSSSDHSERKSEDHSTEENNTDSSSSKEKNAEEKCNTTLNSEDLVLTLESDSENENNDEIMESENEKKVSKELNECIENKNTIIEDVVDKEVRSTDDSSQDNTADNNKKEEIINDNSNAKDTSVVQTSGAVTMQSCVKPDVNDNMCNIAPYHKPKYQVLQINNQRMESVRQIQRGIPKSGKWWKSEKNRFSSVIKVKPLKTSWAKKMKLKNNRKEILAAVAEIKEEKRQKWEDLKERQKANKIKKAENAKKSEVVQVINDSRKIKKMTKKQLRLIEKRDTNNLNK